jgi:hypothetical protein
VMRTGDAMSDLRVATVRAPAGTRDASRRPVVGAAA